MLIPINLRADYGELKGENHNRIIASTSPVLSWGGYTDEENNFQTAYHVKVTCGENILWDSDVIKTNKPYAKYNGLPLPVGKRINFSVSIAGNDGTMSEWVSNYFYLGTFGKLPDAKWICASEDVESVPAYFKKDFLINGAVSEAALFVCGIGYNEVTLNGEKISVFSLEPSRSDYNKTCFYNVIPDIEKFLNNGSNEITVTVADGWRRNWGDYLRIYNNTPSFFGTPALWGAMRITYENGDEKWIYTDESWKWGRGPITFSHLFDGETYDARVSVDTKFSVKLYKETFGELKPSTIPPVVPYKTFKPVNLEYIGDGKYIADFGTNMSGVVWLRLPTNMKSGQKITVRHAQLLHDDGTLNTDNLRGAKCVDTYIASGDNRDCGWWRPTFTYHGFRYAEITGIPLLDKKHVTAFMLCNDLKSCSSFKCGSSVVNAINDMLIQTERSTTHGAFNDTCGRSERLCWVCDGNLRYSEIAYNFEIGKMFPFVMSLIRDTQAEDGSTTCTAPFVYGKRPADPLNSAYLMLAEEAYLRTGNIEIVSEYYDSFRAWEQCLIDNSDNYIMNYSYYGDWAGPEYSRDPNTKGGGAGSATIPAIMVGTGMLINNAKTLKRFAEILGKADDVKYYDDLFNKAKDAFLNKWYDSSSYKVYNGSQSCQALALWLGILPESDRTNAAEIMRDDLINSGYRFTTGVYCLKFMLEMLIEYGYVNEFYELMTKETYPSLGYMIQCGATTSWEKYEYLTGDSMNAHIHPIQSTMVQCFYKYIAGIVPVGEGASEFDIKPYYPDGLLTASMTQNTARGDLTVRWRKLDGKTNLCVNVPFNTKVNIHIPDGVKTVGSGFYSFVW
ncbi:MAG: family 78 glycoside hydrolase catalytic domain [Clostridia bacterium]|nr:family 78 glycoside hydrolase catalytic domain [Clostridia bacterium]